VKLRYDRQSKHITNRINCRLAAIKKHHIEKRIKVDFYISMLAETRLVCIDVDEVNKK